MSTWLWRFDWRPEPRALVLAEAEALGLREPFAPGLFTSAQPYEAGRAAFGVGGGEVVADSAAGPLDLPSDLTEVHVARGPFKPSGNPRDFARRIGVRTAARGCPYELYDTGARRLVVRAVAEPRFVEPDLPIRTSTSFSPRLARAVLNLVARPGERVLDPVCGTGVLLVEAGRLGCAPTGWDINPRACRAARENLESQGLAGAVEARDARDGLGETARFDAVVGDLPYGIRLAAEPDLAPLATALPRLGRRWALVAMTDLTPALAAAGLPATRTLAVPKYTITRYVMVGGERLRA